MTAQPNAWEESYKKLPPEAQTRVQAWIGTQMFLARELGLTSEQWLSHVEWAFGHPLDFSFMGEDAAKLPGGSKDGVTTGPDARTAAAAIGGTTPALNAPNTSAPADPTKVRKAGLANMAMLGQMLDDKKPPRKKG